MPSINIVIGPQGPVMDIQIGVSAPRQQALIAANSPVPTPIMGRFLIDTGASNTSVDISILTALGLTPTGSTLVHTPTTGAVPVPRDQYDVSVVLVTPALTKTWYAIPVIESGLTAQGLMGLLGRDVLQQCVLVYHGELRYCTLCF